MKNLIKNFIRQNFILSILLSRLSIISSFFLDGFLCRIFRYDDYWLHFCSFGYIPYWHVVYRPEQKFSESTLIFFSTYIPKKGDVVLELGAGIGNETLVISKLIGKTGKIITLEPHPKTYNYLLKTLAFNKLKNVEPEQCVLSYSKNNIYFTDLRDDWIKNKISNDGQIKIKKMSFEDLFNKYQIKKINFLKCNIEGSEIELLKINKENLFKIENLCIECHDFMVDSQIQTYLKIKNFLKNNGYHIFDNYKKTKTNKHNNYYIYASKNKYRFSENFFYLRDKLDYVSFNKILRSIISKI